MCIDTGKCANDPVPYAIFAKSEGFAMQEMSVLQDCFVANIPGKDMTAAIVAAGYRVV